MTEIKLIELPSEAVIQEKVSLKPERKQPVKKYEIEKKELSENIRRFDRKAKAVYLKNPFDYNAVALGQKREEATPSASEMITNPTYNSIGKFLGVDTIHDWNRYYDKVFTIVQWVKSEEGLGDPLKITKYLSGKLRTIPSLGAKRIDDLYLHAKMRLKK